MSFPILTVSKELSGSIPLTTQSIHTYKSALQKEINQLRGAIDNQNQKIQSAHTKKLKQRLLATKKQIEEFLSQREIALVQLNQTVLTILSQSPHSLQRESVKVKTKKQVKQVATPIAIKVNPSTDSSIQAIMKEKAAKPDASSTLDAPFSTVPSSDQATAETSEAPLEATLSSPSPSSEITEEKAVKPDAPFSAFLSSDQPTTQTSEAPLEVTLSSPSPSSEITEKKATTLEVHSKPDSSSSKPLNKKEIKWYNVRHWSWLKTAFVGTAILAGAYFFYQKRSSISSSLTRLIQGPTPNPETAPLLMSSESPPPTANNRDSYFSQLYKNLHDTIHYYLKDKGHSLDWLVRHNKISEDLKKWIEEKGKMQKHWNR
ncbi:hypothetical protein [Candidatus Protochlamydia phocaeensis]|uniref:hypothetical protein n=1 Tax=Candidatus Protochlamydia phocaeensis TaxID=1414722 RepID=UPI0008382346|nr:hypothetical protein [Candidatus Protochlamydia phocaeensis]